MKKMTNNLIPISDHLKPGMVLRMVISEVYAVGLPEEFRGMCFSEAFSDATVVKVEGETITLARPYLYTTETGTVLTGVEQYQATIDRLKLGHRIVCGARFLT